MPTALPSPADLHLLLVRTDGSDAAVVRSALAAGARPWLVVAPETVGGPAQLAAGWEPLVEAAGYELGFFDGRSRYYCAAGHAEAALRLALEVPGPDAGPVAGFDAEARAELERLRSTADALALANATLVRELVRWRAKALEGWAASAARRVDSDAETLRAELDAVRATLSWRITRPLLCARYPKARGFRPHAMRGKLSCSKRWTSPAGQS